MSRQIVIVLTALALLAPAAMAAARHGGAHGTQTATATAPATTSPTSAITQGAVAIVNDTVISDYDLTQRILLFIVISGMRPTAENMPLIREQVLRTLEDETLEMKEAQAHGVTVTKEEVDTALAGISKDNNTTPEAIADQLAKGGVSIGTFRSQIMAQIAWNRVVQARYGSRLEVTDDEAKAAIARLQEGSTKPQFRVSEIYLGIDKPEDEAKVRATAVQLVAQINAGAPFGDVARQFSQSPSAASGGDIGWVIQGQLSDEIDKALQTLHRGQIAGPIRSVGGFYIIMLRSRLEPVGTHVPVVPHGPPTGPVPLARLLLPLPPNAPAEYRPRAIAFANDVAEHATSCAELQAIAVKTHAVFMSLGTVDPKMLSADVQASLAKTEPGGVGQPFLSAAGVEVIARCDARVDPLEVIRIPTPDQMKDQLFQQKAEILARSYLRDLRRDAVIETR